MSRLLSPDALPPVSAYDHLQRDLNRMSPGMKSELVFYNHDGEKLYFETMDDSNCEIRGWVPLNLQEGYAMYALNFPALLAQVEEALLTAVANPPQP